MNGHIDDKAFEEYLKRGSPVSQQYQALESDDVPADLDREVLAQANEAVRLHREKRRSWQRWSVPVALAASTVLAVSIVIQSSQHESTLTRAPSYPQPVQDVQHEPARAEERIAESPAEADQGTSVPSSQIQREADEQVSATRERALAASERREKQAQARSSLAAPAAPGASDSAQKRAEAKADSGDADTSQKEDEQERRVHYEAMRTASRSPAAPPPPASVQQARSAVPARREVNSPGFTSETQTAEASHRDPEEWLREIRELRAAGKAEEAEREWKAFREAFPDHDVAKDDPAMGL